MNPLRRSPFSLFTFHFSLSPRLPLLLLLSLLIAGTASAHVFWLEPSAFHAADGDLLKIKLRVGDTLPGEVTPRNDERIVEFVDLAPDATRTPILGRDGAETAGIARLHQEGLHQLVYRSTRASVTLEATKFEAYLKEKGLDKIVQQRHDAGQSADPGREVYSRCAKAFVRIGTADGKDFDRKAGLKLELVPHADPTALHAGDELSVELLLDGKPLANSLVEAKCREDASAKVSARTDDKGMVKLKLAKEGMWLIDAVEMFRAPADTGADWESLWASLSFEIPATPKTQVAPATPTTTPSK